MRRLVIIPEIDDTHPAVVLASKLEASPQVPAPRFTIKMVLCQPDFSKNFLNEATVTGAEIKKQLDGTVLDVDISTEGVLKAHEQQMLGRMVFLELEESRNKGCGIHAWDPQASE